MKICMVEKCGLPHSSKGYCVKHYLRMKSHGTTDRPKCLREGCINPQIETKGARYCSIECKREARKLQYIQATQKQRELYPDKTRELRLKSRYGITQEKFDSMLLDQNGLCAICKTDTPGDNRGWHIDHDHNCCPGQRSCGKCVRGLLCNVCNMKVVPLVENPDLIEAGLRYLELWKRGD